ncbi:MAG TPA: hypothetical protein VM821_00575 [Abditibacteriaceae bacterium]|nr:hypothetical protein [Abditibacteriaceae bacterium]
MRNRDRVLDLTTKARHKAVDETRSAVLDGVIGKIGAQQHQNQIYPQREVEAVEEDGNQRQPNYGDHIVIDSAAILSQLIRIVAGFRLWLQEVNV